MIQRIQTVFWLLGAMAFGSLFFTPFATISADADRYEMTLAGVEMEEHAENAANALNTWPVLVLAIVIFAISLLVIFQYKRRMIQMRLTIYNILLMIGLLIMGYLYARQAADVLTGELQAEFISVMPVVAIIFNILAWRGVRRDYLMLKAVDRIR